MKHMKLTIFNFVERVVIMIACQMVFFREVIRVYEGQNPMKIAGKWNDLSRAFSQDMQADREDAYGW